MTFSLLVRDGDGFGMAVTSSSPAVAARCLHLRQAVGGVASQNITDPRFGPILLDALQAGAGAAEALDHLIDAEPTIAYRQISVVDSAGGVAVHSGAHTLGVHATATAAGAAAAGNLLDSPGVIDAALAGFLAAEGELEERLLTGLQAGLDAGGEAGDLRSAGLAVVREVGWNSTDLRVDFHDQPLSELARILDIWLPQRQDYITRGVDPRQAPAYGVPGDD